MPTQQNPNPLGCLDFVIYPLAILIGIWGLTTLGNFLEYLIG